MKIPSAYAVREHVLAHPDEIRVWAREAMRVAAKSVKPAACAKRKPRTRRAG